MPTAEQWEAGLYRAQETIRLRRGDLAVPLIVGVKLAEDCYALWIHHLEEDALVFTRVEAPDAPAAEKLLAVAADEARWWGHTRMLAWDVDERLLARSSAHAPVVRSTARTYNVPIVAWLDDLTQGEELDWAFIERFAVVLEA
jgi:hypothetical protein